MDGEKPLLIFASSLPSNLFTNEAFVIACSLGRINEIKTNFLLNTRATGITFINLVMACYVYDVLQISFIQLAKPKPIRKFDGKPAQPITHAIYPTLTVQSYTKLLAPFLITKLDQHPLILGMLWMQKYGIILDMSCDKLVFWSRHCQHPGALSLTVNTPVELHLSTSMHLSTSAYMPLAPHMDNSITSATALTEPQNSKKSKKLTKIKIPPAIPDVRPVYQGISKLADSKREKYVVLTKCILKSATILKLVPPMDKIKSLDLAFIGAAPFQYLAKQKDIKTFVVFMQDIKNELNAILMKNIKYQLNKTAKTSTDPKIMIPKEYHKFLDVFSKEASDNLSPHSKYDHKIWLLGGYKDHGNSLLSKMLEPKLQFMKKFLEKHLEKGFIKASSTLCSSCIMLAVKPDRGIRFCVNYRCLNKLTKKDAYPLPLIKEILAQLKNTKVFTKIDICQAFHKHRMAANSEDYTMFASQFEVFKWKVLLFRLMGGPAS